VVLKSEIKSADGLAREIEVEIPQEEVDAAFADMYRKYQKQAKVKGFRPGKVPLNIVKSMYSEAIKEEILQDLVSKSYPNVIQQQKLNVASPPEIKNFELNEGAPFKYDIKIEVMPEVEEINLEGLELPKQEYEVTDVEVDSVVKHLQTKAATKERVDRPAEKTDIILMDLEKIEDPDNALPETKYDDVEVDLGAGVTVEEFRDGLEGVKAGDEKDITVNYPEDFSNPQLAGKKITYHCKIKEIREKVLPEANDAFAKAQGDFETMLEMRMKIREDVKKQKENEHRDWEKKQLMDQINEKNPVPIPAGMIEKYLDSVVEDALKQGQKIDVEELRKQYRPIAENGIRWNIIADKLAEQENIEVSPSDTENWIKGFAASYNMEPDKAKEMLSKTGKLDEIRHSIREDKIFDHIMQNVNYVEVASPEQNSESGGEGKEIMEEGNNITEEK